MKVALVLGGNEEGGLEKHFVELAHELSAQGVRVVAIAHAKYADRFEAAIEFVAVNLAMSRRNPWVLFALWRALKQAGPDVIHAHAGKATAMVGVLLPFLSMPAVATVHNLKRRFAYLGRFQALIAVSANVAQQLTHQNIHIVHNGIRLPRCANEEVQNQLRAVLSPDGRPIILAIGRLVVAKGFDILLSAWRQASPDAVLLIVGDGPESQSLTQYIGSAALLDDVKMLGVRADVTDLLTVADCLVIASRNEGGPYTLAEALLLRCPVLSTRVGMVPDYLSDKFLCATHDASALAQLLERFLVEPKRLRELQAAAFEQAQDQLTLSAMTAANKAIYQRLINE